MKILIDSDIELIEASGVKVFHCVRNTVIEISGIEVPMCNRRKGMATLALLQLLHIAKKYKMDLALTPDPYGKNGMSKTALKKWYRKHGFIANKTARYANWETVCVLIHPAKKPI